MPHVQLDPDFPIIIHKVAMSFSPGHRFFEDIYPFSRFDLDSRSDSQLSSFSIALGLSYDGAKGMIQARLDLHFNSSLCSTAERLVHPQDNRLDSFFVVLSTLDSFKLDRFRIRPNDLKRREAGGSTIGHYYQSSH